MVDYADLFWLILAALILINAGLFILVYVRISEQRDKTKAKRGSVAEKEATQKCLHFFGYLADEHPRNKPIPKECFGCTLAMECINKHGKEKIKVEH